MNDHYLVDFRTVEDVSDWIEVSDTVRVPGKSKATIVLQKSQLFQRAVFFTLLNPQDNGAAFAGVKKYFDCLDLSTFSDIIMLVKAQGNTDYKVVLVDKEAESSGNTYEYYFQVSSPDFEVVRAPLSEFVLYHWGKPVNDPVPLNKAQIRSFGIQMFGGVYSEKKQKGPSSLEIDYIQLE